MQTGYITNVTREQLGANVVSWAGSALTVDNASDFPGEGQFKVEGSDAVFTYSDVTEGDPYDDMVTTPEAPSGVSGGVSLTLYPDAWVTYADVALFEEGDAIPCEVPYTMQPFLPLGVREDESVAETVEVEEINGVWRIKEIRAQIPPKIGADGLTEEVMGMIESAGAGKTTTTHAYIDPNRDGVEPGDTWFKHDQTTLNTTGMWFWDGTAWVEGKMDGATIANLDAGSITTGILKGIGLIGTWLFSNRVATQTNPDAHAGVLIRGGLIRWNRVISGALKTLLQIGYPDGATYSTEAGAPALQVFTSDGVTPVAQVTSAGWVNAKRINVGGSSWLVPKVKIDSSGIKIDQNTVSAVQSGRYVVTLPTNSTGHEVRVEFPQEYSTSVSPRMFVNISSVPAGSSFIVARATNSDSTGFTLRLFNLSGVDFNGAQLAVDWMATL